MLQPIAARPETNKTNALNEARRFTRNLALSHYENFIVGGLLTPRELRQDFYNIYAYCRMADDLADELRDPRESLLRLDQWQGWLEDCYASRRVEHPVFVALRETIDRFEIPAEPFVNLLTAFRQDQIKHRYATMGEVLQYCNSSANPVGHLVLHLGRCFSQQRADLSDRICTGLQLANFWQDVKRDADMGRVYIPLEVLERFGVSDADLNCSGPPRSGPHMVAELVEYTAEYFEQGLPLADEVPSWLGKNIRLFAGGGKATLAAIRGVGCDVWTRRPTVGKMSRLKLLAREFFWRR